MNAGWQSLTAAAACVAMVAGAARADGNGVHTDPAGDAVLRRTDLGASAPISPASLMPDLLSVTLVGWNPQSPANPYGGSPVDPEGPDPHVLRMDVVFAGLINPPGPLGLGGEAFDPFRFGPSPVYGFIDLDVDRDKDTGGELGGAAVHRFLANAARFGCVPYGSLGERAATGAAAYDYDFYTAPHYERSGAEFSLVLCGCAPLTVVSAGGGGGGGEGGGDGDQQFEAGETWIVRGRLFQRAGGYRLASAVSGGSDFGLYDPMVNLRWSHDPVSDRTTATLVFPLDMQGAATLTGQPQQPMDAVIDTVQGGIPNHFSVREALQDLIRGANGQNGGPLTGPTRILTDRWRNKDSDDYLDPTRWEVTAIVGTSYSAPSSALYAWTDTGFECTTGDQDGDGSSNDADRSLLQAFIAASDGGASDADGVANGSVSLPNAAANFSPFDINGDGVVNSADAAFYGGNPCPGDWDHDGRVLPQDVSAFIVTWFNDLTSGTTVADFDHNGTVQPADVSLFVVTWFGCL